MDDIINWPIIKQLSDDFVANIKFVYIYNYGKSIICVCNNDNVYSYGDNTNGYLGLGHNHSIEKPTKIEELCHKQVCDFNTTSNSQSIIALTKTGQIYSWGLNSHGQCGNGNNDECLKPVLIKALKDKQVIDVKCGSHHCLALTLNEDLFEWGWSVSGKYNYVPIKVIGLENCKVIAISCGELHSLVLTDNGDVFNWGWNEYGQCGNGSFDDQITPIKINLNEKIIKIIGGPFHSILLSENGDIFAFGANNCGQLGNGTKDNSNLPLMINILTKFVDIFTQYEIDISIGLSIDGFFYVWGKCGEQSLDKPIKTQFKDVYEVLANYSDVKVTYKPYYFKQKFEKLPILLRLEKAFDVKEMSDIAFKIDGKFIYVHSIYLRMVCKHFDVMFAPNVWLESNSSEIEITQYSYSVYYSFLKYLYTDSVDIEIEDIIELYYLADSYFEDNLKLTCIEIMKKHANIYNVFNYWSFAVINHLNELENFFFDFIKTHIKEVIKTESYLQMNDITILQKFVECIISN